jgi:Activator of Hsp90 ATPase homolog 1-like protein
MTPTPGHVMIETVTLEALDDGSTRLVATMLCPTPEERDGVLHSGMEGGVNRQYDALDRVLAELEMTRKTNGENVP